MRNGFFPVFLSLIGARAARQGAAPKAFTHGVQARRYRIKATGLTATYRKLGIFAASLVAGGTGFLLLFKSGRA